MTFNVALNKKSQLLSEDNNAGLKRRISKRWVSNIPTYDGTEWGSDSESEPELPSLPPLRTTLSAPKSIGLHSRTSSSESKPQESGAAIASPAAGQKGEETIKNEEEMVSEEEEENGTDDIVTKQKSAQLKESAEPIVQKKESETAQAPLTISQQSKSAEEAARYWAAKHRELLKFFGAEYKNRIYESVLPKKPVLNDIKLGKTGTPGLRKDERVVLSEPERHVVAAKPTMAPRFQSMQTPIMMSTSASYAEEMVDDDHEQGELEEVHCLMESPIETEQSEAQKEANSTAGVDTLTRKPSLTESDIANTVVPEAAQEPKPSVAAEMAPEVPKSSLAPPEAVPLPPSVTSDESEPEERAASVKPEQEPEQGPHQEPQQASAVVPHTLPALPSNRPKEKPLPPSRPLPSPFGASGVSGSKPAIASSVLTQISPGLSMPTIVASAAPAVAASDKGKQAAVSTIFTTTPPTPPSRPLPREPVSNDASESASDFDEKKPTDDTPPTSQLDVDSSEQTEKALPLEKSSTNEQGNDELSSLYNYLMDEVNTLAPAVTAAPLAGQKQQIAGNASPDRALPDPPDAEAVSVCTTEGDRSTALEEIPEFSPDHVKFGVSSAVPASPSPLSSHTKNRSLPSNLATTERDLEERAFKRGSLPPLPALVPTTSVTSDNGAPSITSTESAHSLSTHGRVQFDTVTNESKPILHELEPLRPVASAGANKSASETGADQSGMKTIPFVNFQAFIGSPLMSFDKLNALGSTDQRFYFYKGKVREFLQFDTGLDEWMNFCLHADKPSNNTTNGRKASRSSIHSVIFPASTSFEPPLTKAATSSCPSIRSNHSATPSVASSTRRSSRLFSHENVSSAVSEVTKKSKNAAKDLFNVFRRKNKDDSSGKQKGKGFFSKN
ncbi:hypothetical protein SJAG_05179 [Schizosaccharomyces japonicus yFS275]|uniref:Uncharacterized protein n=1 Tax=Schizosaccharomyces japonicus (strain yFS275 / FY16936) TaxID=402676 RepID=B6JXL5_SCHJY|nr:hypothetical protein SJAG_05179 [Schizosaccharomyces japonicus yFS275]EEB05159.1 hypothetical protein SJAG_05179 [Schizosaccharomyces japonicus yFS275]